MSDYFVLMFRCCHIEKLIIFEVGFRPLFLCALMRGCWAVTEFLTLVGNEGFTFGDGVKPTEKHSSDVFAVNDNKTISYVGIVGRTAIGSKVNETGGKEIVKVDFERYISGDDDYNW